MARMKVLFVLCLPLWLLPQAYIIDDRDSVMTYSGSAWQRFSDPSAYMGTTTDNACLTSQNCQFSFSFTGSGVSLTRYIITSIPIPLAATVTIDGEARGSISIPDKSPTTVVYDYQQLTSGYHTMQVVLVSYNGANSHFRLDYVTVNETVYPPVPTPSRTTSLSSSTFRTTSSTKSVTQSATSLSKIPPVSKKKRIGPVIGGVIGGIALLTLACLLFFLVFLRRRRRQQARVESPLPDTRGPEAQVSQIEHSSDINWATMPPATPLTVASPPAGFYPFNTSGTDGLILGQHPYMPPAVPEASDNLGVGLPHASIITQPAVVRPPITSSSPNRTTPATTSIISASTSEPLPLEIRPPIKAPAQDHDFQDLSSVNSSTSPGDSTINSGTTSIASSAPLVPGSTRYLTDEEVDFVASLYRQRLSPPDIARIVENMLEEGEMGSKGEGPSSGIVVMDSKPTQPPAYDFKDSGRG